MIKTSLEELNWLESSPFWGSWYTINLSRDLLFITEQVKLRSHSHPQGQDSCNVTEQQKIHAVTNPLFPSGWGRKLCLELVFYIAYKAWLNIKAIVIVRPCSPSGYGYIVCFSVRKGSVLADGAFTSLVWKSRVYTMTCLDCFSVSCWQFDSFSCSSHKSDSSLQGHVTAVQITKYAGVLGLGFLFI